ncbi:CBS domain-containing protein [uncultured Roseibium sp.]|uniref:CBS domain-containing protein n=1 Tax=uncultured Roseibium sp. TaxID=1936171 RepID=UPI00321648E1
MSATTRSQSSETNLQHDTAIVRNLLQSKGADVFGLRPQNTLHEAVEMLRDKKVGALIVKDSEGKLRGILSERDIVRKLAETPGQTLAQRVEDVMTTNVETCELDDPLILVLRKMTDGRFRHMPVIEDGNLVGIVSIGDVVNYRLNELEYEALQLKQLIVG